MIKRLLKGAATAILPDITLRITAIRSRRLIERQVRGLGLDSVARTISRHTGSQVASGPFRAMRIDYDALPVHSSPKLLGTYEREIASCVEDAIGLDPPFILNVGASDGYYAVGLALRLPLARVFAAEADPKSLRATVRNAALNSVEDRVSAVGVFRSGEFSKYLCEAGSLLVMDCEGAEFVLLDPTREPALRVAVILVEVHRSHGTPDELASRFRQTHSARMVSRVPRTPSEMPVDIPNVDPVVAMDERRGEETWLYLSPAR